MSEPEKEVPTEHDENDTTVDPEMIDEPLTTQEEEAEKGTEQGVVVVDDEAQTATKDENETDGGEEQSQPQAQEATAAEQGVVVDEAQSAKDNNTNAGKEQQSQSQEEEEAQAAGQGLVVDEAQTTKDSKTNGGEEQSKPKKRSPSLVGPPETVTEGDSDDDEEANMKINEKEDENPWVTRDSDIRDPQRRICVVTTAALPWRTGTAVNALLRALYLTRGRPKHYVTLVIPWCPNENDRKLTLGKEHDFANQNEQEQWIREFCRDRAGCTEEEKQLKIIFYESKYNESFGSIFPSVDICSIIPDEDADVAILEEPEHLNWLRVPKPYNASSDNNGNGDKTNGKMKRVATAKDKAELGWRFKFRHVVGIIHTNYKAYAEQYGVGAKFITAPALCALNALVVRAYCHRVILLSGTLPSLTPYKEVTCNVHGVRREFLERPVKSRDERRQNNKNKGEKPAQVYFIGKLIWVKGFDKILDLENIYREKHNDFFPLDIYGAGGDEKPLKRAFFGRIPQIQRNDSPQSNDIPSPDWDDTAEVFTWESSIRSHLVDKTPFKETEKHECFDDIENMVKRRSSLRDVNGSGTPSADLPQSTEVEAPKRRGSLLEDLSEKVMPISVLGDLSKKALDTTKATSGAAVAMAKNVVDAGLNVTFTKDVGSPNRGTEDKDGSKGRKQKLIFDPPQSVFEFRRNPIPARFLGTKDHIFVRDIPEHKIFLNMSITEVLCTTSAEALAMGKFVILPKHPSNTFFYQFPNCLKYSSIEECLEKLEWALKHEPKVLSEESALKLSWEGANQRLFESSAIRKDEWEEWEETGKLKSDDDAARFHVETGMKGHLIGKFFTGDKPNDGSEDKK